MTNRGFLVWAAGTLGAALAMVVFLATGAGPAGAAFPGETGKIAYHAATILYWDAYTPVTDDDDVWVINPDGSGRENLTGASGQHERDPAFSPDGTEIAFVRSQYEYGGGDIWAMRADGSGQRNLTGTPGEREDQPAWSPDGTRVAFVRGGDVWAVGADGTGEENLTDTPGVHEREPAFSPDGGSIAFSAGGDVWAMRADGTTRENLTRAFDEAFDERGYHSDEQSPSFSPDGGKIAFGAHLYGHSGDSYERCSGNVFAMGAGGGSAWTNLTRLPESGCSNDGWSAGSPAYSPDGREIAYVNAGAEGDVALMDGDGSNQRYLDTYPEPDDPDHSHYASSPDWQPVCPCPEVPLPDAAAPTITGARPAPGSKVRDRAPTIRAVVRDETDELAKSNITLRVDGRERGFSYDAGTDRLSRATKKLSYGRHTVKVTATDRAGNAATERWSFRVGQRPAWPIHRTS